MGKGCCFMTLGSLGILCGILRASNPSTDMFLGGRRKPENTDEIHMHMRKTRTECPHRENQCSESNWASWSCEVVLKS